MLKVMFGGRVGAGNLGVNQRERGLCLLPGFAFLSLNCCVEQTLLNMTPPRREWCVRHG